jgi:hypothetical protein
MVQFCYGLVKVARMLVDLGFEVSFDVKRRIVVP